MVEKQFKVTGEEILLAATSVIHMDIPEDLKVAFALEFGQYFVSRFHVSGDGNGDMTTPVLAALLRVGLQHFFEGLPLEFPQAVIAVYELGEPETPLFECERCGYGQPRVFTACVLCGGKTGLGLHHARMALAAINN